MSETIELHINHVADGDETVFPFPFRAFNESDVRVYLGGVQVSAGFTVALNFDGFGGSVVFDTPPALGEDISLVRTLAFGRATEFATGGLFRANSVNREFDHQLAMIEQAVANSERGIRLHPTDDVAALQLPSKSDRAQRYLAFDADGNLVAATEPLPAEGAVASSFISTFLLPAVDAAAARSALELDSAATVAVGTAPDEVPTNADLGTAALRDVGTANGNVPVLDPTGKLATATIPLTLDQGPFQAPTFRAGDTGQSGTGFVAPDGQDLQDKFFGQVALPRDMGTNGTGNAFYFEYTLEQAAPGQIRLAFIRKNYEVLGDSGGGADPGPLSCVPAGTPVLMADGSFKPIEDVRIGEVVRGLYGYENEVIALDPVRLGRRPLYLLNGGLWITAEHMMRGNDGWCAISRDACLAERQLHMDVIVDDETDESASRLFVGVDPSTVVEAALGDELVWYPRGVRPIESLEPYIFAADTPLYSLVLGGSHTMVVAGGYVISGWARDDDFDYERGAPREAPRRHDIAV